MRLIDADKIMADIAASARSTSKDYSLLSIARYISIQPTIDAEPVRHGHWKVVDEAEPRRYGCSRCKVLSYDNTNYCPRCGAKMEEVEE